MRDFALSEESVWREDIKDDEKLWRKKGREGVFVVRTTRGEVKDGERRRRRVTGFDVFSEDGTCVLTREATSENLVITNNASTT